MKTMTAIDEIIPAHPGFDRGRRFAEQWMAKMPAGWFEAGQHRRSDLERLVRLGLLNRENVAGRTLYCRAA